MKRIIEEVIYEFIKYGTDLSKEEIIKLTYNEVKVYYPCVKLSKVKEMVEKYF